MAPRAGISVCMRAQKDLKPWAHRPSGFTSTTKQTSKVHTWREQGERSRTNQRWLSSLSSAALQLPALAWGYDTGHFSVNLWLIVKMINKLTHSKLIPKNTWLISIERNFRTSTFFAWSNHDTMIHISVSENVQSGHEISVNNVLQNCPSDFTYYTNS